MKPRFWLLLTLALPLVLGSWAWFSSHRAPRFDPTWQPHRLDSFYVQTHMVTRQLGLSTTEQEVASSYYVFNLKTRKGHYAFCGSLADDKEVISINYSFIAWFSARNGKLLKRLKLPIDYDPTLMELSWDAGIVCFISPVNEGPRMRWDVYEVATARFMWSFEAPDLSTPSFMDETLKLYFVAAPDRQVWEVRDLQSGEIKRTLPLIPGTRAGMISRDAATLYTVANSVLYGQRAR